LVDENVDGALDPSGVFQAEPEVEFSVERGVSKAEGEFVFSAVGFNADRTTALVVDVQTRTSFQTHLMERQGDKRVTSKKAFGHRMSVIGHTTGARPSILVRVGFRLRVSVPSLTRASRLNNRISSLTGDSGRFLTAGQE
jgi:hypothetical protein